MEETTFHGLIIHSSFPSSQIETVICQVLELAKGNQILKQLDNYYYEGFQLPYDADWYDKLASNPKAYQMTSRRLIFNTNKSMVDGLLFKDGIKCWTAEEISELEKIMTQVVKNL